MAAGPLPTIREVARLAGVSVATVSKALNGSGKVSAPLQERVNAAAQTLGYATHASARSLRGGATRVIGLLVADLSNPYLLKLVEHIEQLSSAADYSVILCNSAEDPKREERHMAMLRSQRADGAIIIPTRASWAGRTLALSSLPVPAVLVDGGLDGLELDSVETDNLTVGRLAAEHLYARGHRRVGVVMGPPGYRVGRHRLEGFRAFFAEHGVWVEDRFVRTNNYTEAAGHAAALDLLAQAERPTAVFATNNHMAFALLRAAADRGMVVPDDVSLIAVDDLPWANLIRPGVTVVVQPSAEIAQSAVGTLLERISQSKAGVRDYEAKAMRLQPTLIVRGSTADVGGKP